MTVREAAGWEPCARLRALCPGRRGQEALGGSSSRSPSSEDIGYMLTQSKGGLPNGRKVWDNISGRCVENSMTAITCRANKKLFQTRKSNHNTARFTVSSTDITMCPEQQYNQNDHKLQSGKVRDEKWAWGPGSERGGKSYTFMAHCGNTINGA